MPMQDKDTLSYFLERFNKMDAERTAWSNEWSMCDAQYEAEIVENPTTGQVNINNPLEATLSEMDLWRTAGRPNFDITPDPYDPNPEEVETAKYILDNFLDREWFITEYRSRRLDKGIYGTGILFCGLRYEQVSYMWFGKDKKDAQVWRWFFSKKKRHEVKKEKRYMTPMNVPIRHFWIDDSVFYQSDYKKAKDCVMAESMSLDAFHKRYEGNKNFDQKIINIVQPIQEDDPSYWISTTNGLVVVYHYYNKVDNRYVVVVNKSAVIYDGDLPYKHGMLPFVMCQHYPNNSCVYGYGIPRRARLSKAYLNNITQDIINWSRMSSSKILGIGSSGEPVDGDLIAIPWAITMARFTNWVSDLRDIDTQVNVSPLIQARQMVNEMVRNDTWYDMNAPFEAAANTLWQTEILEENKQLRYKAIDESRDLALDDALYMTLCNISQFAPILLKRKVKIKDKDWKVISEKETRPTIQIKDVSIKKEKWSTVISEDYGSYWYLEFKDDTITGDLKVRVITPNTHNPVLVTIEKNKAKEMVQSYIELSQIKPELVEEQLPMSEVIEKFKKAYWYDKTMIPMTKKKKIMKENEEKLKALQEILNPIPDENDPMAQMTNMWWGLPAPITQEWPWPSSMWEWMIAQASQSSISAPDWMPIWTEDIEMQWGAI